MNLRQLIPYMVILLLVLSLVLLVQVNGLSNQIAELSGAVVIDDGGSDVVPTQAPAAPSDIEVDISGDPYIGGNPDDAKVLIVEFSDFQCSYCGRAIPTIASLLEKYGDDISIVFKNFPLGFHENAQKAAEAGECADEQDKFWEYHDTLFYNQGALDKESLIKYAEDLDLDVDKFTVCLESGAMTSEVNEDMKHGQAAGIRGTPGFIVNGVLISGAQPQAVFEAEIDKYL
jgi:protein-disulfide isomerase